MPVKDTRTPRRVFGPTQRLDGSNHGSWQITVEYTDGSVSNKTRSSKASIEQLKTKIDSEILAAEEAGAVEREYPDYDGTVTWWSSLLAKMSKEVYARPRDPDLRNGLKAIASAATSAKGLYDISDMEARLKETEQFIAEIRAARDLGTRT